MIALWIAFGVALVALIWLPAYTYKVGKENGEWDGRMEGYRDAMDDGWQEFWAMREDYERLKRAEAERIER